MSYDIEALVGQEVLLRQHRPTFRHAYIISLAQTMALIPMTGALVSDIHAHAGGSSEPRQHGFEHLSSAVAAWAAHISREAAVAYVEAGYFGNMGSQRAVVWQQGAITLVAFHNHAINQALQIVGVQRRGDADAFDAVGLGRYRRTARWAAAAAVEELMHQAADPIAVLIAALQYEDTSELRDLVRAQAARCIGQYGQAAVPAISALRTCLTTDEEYGVRLEAACALAAIGPDAVPALTRSLTLAARQGRWRTMFTWRGGGRATTGAGSDQWPVVFALGRLGPAAAAAVPRLVEVLRGAADGNVRTEAAATLGKIGQAAAAIPALIAALRDQEWTVRTRAAEALGAMSPVAPEVTVALTAACYDANEHVRAAAGAALARIREEQPTAPEH